MANLNISVNRELIKSIQAKTYEIAALEKHVNDLKALMSGEPVEISSEQAAKIYKKAIVIGQARRGGLQSQLGHYKKIYDHVCERSSGAPGLPPAGTVICNNHPDSKHLPEWPADGPTQEQREEAWRERWPVEEQVARINREIEQSEKRLNFLRDKLEGERKRFGDEAVKVAIMANAVAPENG